MEDSLNNRLSSSIFIILIMIEVLNNYLKIIIIYFPLGIIGIWRWSIWMIKKVVAKKYKPIRENGYNNTLSIVVPVYNEDPAIFQKALESWKDNNPDEIIAVIDHTDKACIEKFKKFKKQNEATKLIITKRPGKREALADGIKASQYNIIALIDSDTIWNPKIKNALLAPFKDPSVGGVGPRQDVLEINTLARRLFNIHLDHRYLDEMTYLATVANALTCLSGRTALYRKEAIEDLCDELENETFWGAKCISGDDKCITRLVQEKGWKVKYQASVIVLTPGASDLGTLLKQHIRWARNSYRSDLKSLLSKWIWKREKFLAFHMIDRFTQPFTLILGPIYFIFSIIWGHWLVAGILVAWWHLSRGIKLYSHLKYRPKDILILPFYIVITYLMAILKIYAMVTIGEQGWITRWDKNRLQASINNIFKKLKSLIPYSATAFIIFLLSLSVVKYKDISVASKNNYDYNFNNINNTLINNKIDIDDEIKFVNVENIKVDQYKQSILDNLNNRQFGYYEIKKKDTLIKIAQKYNANIEAIIVLNKEAIQNPNYIDSGQVIMIPVSELRNTLNKNNLISYNKASVIFDEKENTINVLGEGSTITIPQIYRKLNNDQVLQKLDNQEWILKSNLFIQKGVTLLIDGEDVSYLKLKSGKEGFIWLRSDNGNILINNTKITSWDENNKIPDTNYEDGRSFILAKNNGRMDIVNSDLGYLGAPLDYGEPPVGHNRPGGVYGVSWRISSGTFGKKIITGNVLKSKFHNNYFGVYTFGATGMLIDGNEFYDNVQYGVDPHDDSNNLIIKNNKAYGNGNHGIIVSKRCFNNIFRYNISFDNRLHGIMLDRRSNNNLVENNTVYGNVDGIAIYDSHNNLIRENSVKDNKNGIRANINSSENYVEQNEIQINENGIFIYDNANNNFLIDNFIKNNERGLYIKNAQSNLVKNSLRNGYNKKEIKLNEANDNLIQKIQ